MTAHAVIAIADVLDAMEGPELLWALRNTRLHLLQGFYEDKAMQMFDLDDPEDATTEQLRAAINHFHDRAGIPRI